MRRFALFFLFIRLPLDYLAVVAAGFCAYFLRFTTLADALPASQIIPFDRYLVLVFCLAPLWNLAFAANGLYRTRRIRAVDELSRAVVGSSAATMATILVIFFNRELFASRFVVLAAWALSALFVVAERVLVRAVELLLLANGWGRRRVAVIGSGPSADALAAAISREPGLAMRLVARFPRFDAKAEEALRRQRTGTGLDEIDVVESGIPPEEANRILRFADERQVTLRYGADLFAARRASLDLIAIAGVPLVEILQTPLDGWGRIYKRAFDIVVSALLLVVLSPLLVVLAALVPLASRGPVLFVRRRVGERGTLFRFYKFRSMRVGAPETMAERERASTRPGIVPKPKDDPRWVTPFGRFIRRWSLDELPQLWNVLVGQMSLVGPRPHLPEEVARYAPGEKKLLTVKPGLTGLAQISGRAELAFADEARIDLWYVEHWSPMLDLAILARTPLVVIGKKGAY